MKEFRIGSDLSERHVDAIASLLIQPRLWIPVGDYPAHTEWRDKALVEVEAEQKRAVVAWWGNDEAAVGIYQRDPTDSSRVEIKNLSVERTARGRGLAPFVLRQIECEAEIDFPGVTTLIADVKRTNVEMLTFALRQGFKIASVRMLDGPFTHNGVEDVVLSKKLGSAA